MCGEGFCLPLKFCNSFNSKLFGISEKKKKKTFQKLDKISLIANLIKKKNPAVGLVFLDSIQIRGLTLIHGT